MQINDLKELDINVEEIQYIINQYKNGQNVIVVTGEFSSGKSSFINCFINRRDFLPHGKSECTPVLIDICEGTEGSIEIRKNDGTVFEIDNNAENIMRYAKYEPDSNLDVLSIGIPLNNSGLPERTHLIDTPGTNTVLKEHEEITKYIIKKADAVLYLFNKVISKSDINHINSILEYTSNVIFVMTHSDEEDTKTKDKYSKERISEFIAEAKKAICNGTSIDIDEIIICNVGSIDGLTDRTEIEEISQLIKSYVETQTQERRMRIAQRKIEKIIQKAINNYEIKVALLRKQSELDEEAISSQIKKYEKEQIRYEEEHSKLLEEIERRINQQEEVCRSELSSLLVEEKSTIVLAITKDGFDEKTIETMLNQINGSISQKMRIIIENAISEITKVAYDSINFNLAEINNDFDINTPIVLSVPDIKEYDDSRIMTRLTKVERQIEENLHELKKLKEYSTEEEVDELKKKIRECEAIKENLADRFIQLGLYKPKFIEIENEGGTNVGRITGRVIGEVADLALLLWNPAGAAAEATKGAGEVAKIASEATQVVNAVDEVKDATTIFRYLKIAAGKAAETGKEIDAKKEQMKKVVTTIKKMDDGRRELIEQVQQNTDDVEQDGTNLSTMLDMLSIGHWTEKLGGVIGEAIKPSSRFSIEDTEVKAAYEAKRTALTEESSRISSEIYLLKEQLRDIDDFGKITRLKKELTEKNRALEEKKLELEELMRREREGSSDTQRRNCFIDQLDVYERRQNERGIQLIQAILGKAKMQILERVSTDYYEKIDYLNSLVSDMRKQKVDSTSDLVDCEKNIVLLSNGMSDIRMWFE